MTPARSRPLRAITWQTLRRVGVIVGILSACGTFFGIWLQVRSEEVQAEIQVLSAYQLIPPTDLPGLQGDFTHSGAPVHKLWTMVFRFVNTGDATIIGQGPTKSLIGQGINVSFPPGSKVLNPIKESASFPHKLLYVTDNTLQLQFTQWHRKEEAVYSLYVSGPSGAGKSPPFPTIPKRQIMDGELSVRDLSRPAIPTPSALLDRLPKSIASVGRFLGIVLATSICLGATTAIVLACVRDIQRFLWRRNHYVGFSKYLRELGLAASTSLGDINRFIEKPWSLEDHFWHDFDGPMYPGGPPVWQTWREALSWIALALLIVASSLALIAGAIYR